MADRAEMRSRIDAALRRAVEAGEVPGVVAMAATADGTLYEGAFGLRDLARRPAMTPDTVFRIHSMTKAITSVAAMQLVEEGRLALEGPVPDIGEPALNAPQVLDGFDAAGAPILRPARRPITLTQLLTHTAGFTYEFWNADTLRYVEATGAPRITSGRRAALNRPLAFDPGERWEYGINTDWVGRHRRSPVRFVARGLFPGAHIRSARHGGHEFRAGRGAAGPSRRCASAERRRQPGRPGAAAAGNSGFFWRRRRALFDRARLPALFAHAAERRQLSTARACCGRIRSR